MTAMTAMTTMATTRPARSKAKRSDPFEAHRLAFLIGSPIMVAARTSSWAARALAGGLLLVAAVSGWSCTTFSGVTYTPPSDHYLDLASAAKVCSFVRSCGSPDIYDSIGNSIGLELDPSNYSACMTWVAGRLPINHVGIPVQRKILQCIADATSCVQAGTCLPIELIDGTDSRCAKFKSMGGMGQECLSPSAAIYCDPLGGAVLHCDSPASAPGSQCFINSMMDPVCGIKKGCVEGTATCQGPDIAYCQGNVQGSSDCTVSGNTCGNEFSSGPQCLTDGKLRPCNAAGTNCEGNTALICGPGTLTSYDCSSFGGTCTSETGSALCKTSSDACSPLDASVNTCSGKTVVNMCLSGQVTTFDCAKIGLSCAGGARAGCE
jgi:hypothetical protein